MGFGSKPKPSAPPPPPPAPVFKPEDPKKKKVRGLPDTMSASAPSVLGSGTEPGTTSKTLLGQ